MQQTDLVKRTFQLMFSREVVLYSLILAGACAVTSLVPVVGDTIYLAFQVIFEYYALNLALMLVLKDRFEVGEIPICNPSPKIGSVPAIVWVWNLLINVIVVVVVLIVTLPVIFATHGDCFIPVMIVLLGAAILVYWLFLCPLIMSLVFKTPARNILGSDFKKKLDKRYFLFILVGLLIACAIMLASVVFIIGASVINDLLLNQMSFESTLYYAIECFDELQLIPALFFFALVINITFCGSCIFAYLSWLDKADLNLVGEVLGLKRIGEDAEIQQVTPVEVVSPQL